MKTAVQSKSLYYPILVKIKIFWIKLTIIEPVFHTLYRNLSQGMEVWPPGSPDINNLIHLTI